MSEEKKKSARKASKCRIDNEGRECARCHEYKVWDNYPVDKSRVRGRYPACRACQDKAVRKWQTSNQEKLAEIDRAWRKANPAKVKVTQNTCNKKKYAANPDKYKARVKAYQKANPHKKNEWGQRRRAMKLKALPRWVAAEEIETIFKQARYLQDTTGIEYSVDHIIPLQNEQVCGLHVPANLLPVPSAVNSAKSNAFDSERYMHQSLEEYYKPWFERAEELQRKQVAVTYDTLDLRE